MIKRSDDDPTDPAKELRDISEGIRRAEGDVDSRELISRLDQLAERLTGAATWQCQLATPYAEIYAVGTQDGGHLQYRCAHDPYHSFKG
ncbi:hypothetical protein [Microbacterium wangruii]|uniref:hypothetical protein n=1 Tax=Microbacterium wangruii TaxID=3049073 RepID=UPI00256EB401|nr:hypothetical protein [Microbacterium sp. zg-Y1211]MDL5485940.1 hypothetical protein [Microbacterium sp. zg-Y1211]